MKIELTVQNGRREETEIIGYLNDDRKFTYSISENDPFIRNQKNEVVLRKAMSSALPDSFDELKAFNKLLEMAIEKVNELTKDKVIVN